MEDQQIYRRKDQAVEDHQTKHLNIQDQARVAGHLVQIARIGHPALLRYHLENHLLFVKNLPAHVEVHVGLHVEDHPCKDLQFIVDHPGGPALHKEDPLHEGHLPPRDSLVVLTENQLNEDLTVPRKGLFLLEKHAEDQNLMKNLRVQVDQVLERHHIVLPESKSKDHHPTRNNLLVLKSHATQGQ